MAKEDAYERKGRLDEILRSLGSVAIAFSGGVDSTFLLYEAVQVLRGNVIAITACSPSFPETELQESKQFCEGLGVRQIFVDSDEMEIPEYRDNAPDRCYHCKTALFKKVKDTAKENGIANVADGSNKDDEGDYRPGMKALEELGVISPLRVAGLTKDDIRILSKEAGLPTWQKPSFACLASRIPYGESITPEKLKMAGDAEEILRNLGFKQCRVRVHGEIARIEVLPEDIERLASRDIREKVSTGLKEAGFSYVSMDLQGYRSGSMNEVL